VRLVQVGVGGRGRTWLDTLGRRREKASQVALVHACHGGQRRRIADYLT
jgi:hypothetical protein